MPSVQDFLEVDKDDMLSAEMNALVCSPAESSCDIIAT